MDAVTFVLIVPFNVLLLRMTQNKKDAALRYKKAEIKQHIFTDAS